MKRKYPRTFHLPWSEGATDDDKTHSYADIETMFGNREVVVTEKLDGENTTIYGDGCSHARSLDSGHHPSRSHVKSKAAEIKGQIPDSWAIRGENMFACHSIEYLSLPDFFVMFGMSDENNIALSWNDVLEWGELLEIPTAPVIYRGLWDSRKIQRLYPFDSRCGGTVAEGYVVRVADSFHMDEFTTNVAKFVRANHVTTSQHWSHMEVKPNKKAQQ